MKVLFQAGFDRFSGYGNDAVDMCVALDRIGIEVTPLPISLLPGLPNSFLRLLERDPRGPKDVVVQFSPPGQIRPWRLEGGRRKVGYTMWERTPFTVGDFEGDWSIDGVPQDLTWDGLDLMVVTCPMNVECLRPFFPEPKPMAVVPCGIEGDDWRVKERPQDDRMKFLMVGMLAGRKDPFALLDVWRDLKKKRPDFDATLHLHTLCPGLHPSMEKVYPDLTITGKALSREGLQKLYQSAHVYVSTSRGEGNNKPAMEFMATGGTVMATDWGGHQNWLMKDATYALPVSFAQSEGAPEHVIDARVDRKALEARLLHCWENRAEVSRKGMEAAKWIRASHSWDLVAEKFGRELARVL